jgi:putative membrane protein
VTVRDLPAVNAALNATGFLLLLLGYALIRAGRRTAHRAVMLSAAFTSGLFLVSYLTYHAAVGSVRFRGQGGMRTLYLAILGSHSLLAAVTVPLALVTLLHALRGRFGAHKRMARVTLPIWAYVSVTGVVIYWMLYRL